MSSLYVYTTEGTCIYPEGGSDDASINRYFESVNFVVDTSDSANPSIEAYFRARLASGRPEQMFLRFQGDDPSSLFADCRSAVLDELVDGQGWEIQETANNSDPSMLFQRAVLRPSADPSQVFDNTPLAGRTGLLGSAARSTRKPLTVTGRNYETIADAILALKSQSIVMAVADGDISLSGVGLVFNQATQQYDLTLPRESEQLLQQVSAQDPSEREEAAAAGAQRAESETPEKQRIESELSTIESQLQAIREKDVSQATVRRQLDDVVSTVYPTLSVSTGRSRPGSPGAQSDDGSDGEPITGAPSEGRFSGIFPNVPNGVAIGAAAGLAVVVLLVLVFATGGLGGGEDSGNSEFEVEIEDSNDVVAGEGLEIDIEVTNVGNNSGTQNVTVDAGDLGSKNKKIELSSDNSTSETFSFTTTTDDSDHYTIEVQSEAGGNDSAEVTVLKPATFTIQNVTIESEQTVEGDEINVTAEVENTGGVEGTQTVELSTDPSIGEDSTELTIQPDSSDSTTLSLSTSDGDAGEFTATVSSDDDNKSVDHTVVQPASFNVTIIKAGLFFDDNNNIQITYEVTNEGGIKGTKNVSLKTDPSLNKTATEEFTLDQGETSDKKKIKLDIGENIEEDEEYDAIATIDGEEKHRKKVERTG